jgi:predicted RNase H-like nuclease (RuvC/YqgF family)
MYDSHNHYASDVQGVADEHHTHSARDIGAAEDHDLDMLERRVHSLEADNRELERKVKTLEGKVGRLEGQVEDLTSFSHQQAEHFITLGNQVETLARHVVAQGGF